MRVMRSMALYGAPVWPDVLGKGKNLPHLRASQRVMAIRAARGYRTIPLEAACVLAGSPPWDLVAESFAVMYRWRANLRGQGVKPGPKAMQKSRLRNQVEDLWLARLERQPIAGHRIVEAIRPVLPEWVDDRHDAVTYRLVQVLSGHGCFGTYLHRIKRQATAACHHCGADQDTAQHTLEACSAWNEQRRVLTGVVGYDLSPPALVSAMVDNERSWRAVSSFCEEVMSRKEEAEWAREADPAAPPFRRKKGGGGGRIGACPTDRGPVRGNLPAPVPRSVLRPSPPVGGVSGFPPPGIARGCSRSQGDIG